MILGRLKLKFFKKITLFFKLNLIKIFRNLINHIIYHNYFYLQHKILIF